MKMRWWAALLAVILVIAAAGCGKPSKEEGTSSGTETQSEAVTESATEAPGKDETEPVESTSASKDDETASEEGSSESVEPEKDLPVSFISPVVRDRKDWAYDESAQLITMNRDIQTVQLTEEEAAKYPELAKALADLEGLLESRADDFAAETEDLTKEFLQTEEPENYFPLEYSSTLQVKRADNRILSVLETCSQYGGGVHGTLEFRGYNYDVQTGKLIGLSEICPEEEKLAQVLMEKLLGAYPEELFYSEMEDEIAQYLEDYAVFTVGNDGITFYFSPYVIGPYGSGMFEVKLYYSEECAELIAEKYRGGMPRFTEQISEEESLCLRDASGKEKRVEIYGELVDESEQRELMLMMDDVVVKTGAYGYAFANYRMHLEDGSEYVLCGVTTDNDYGVILIFDVNGDRPAQTDVVGGAHFEAVDVEVDGDYSTDYIFPKDPGEFRLLRRCDLLSTYSYLQGVRLAGGKAEVTGKVYETVRYQEDPLVLKQEMDLLPVKEGTFEAAGEAEHFAAGTKLFFRYTDGIDRVWFALEDGRLVEVKLSSTEWPMQVDGKDIEEVFDGLFFAG
ncbi:MAG: DUF3298 domain-containing protein [Lachnospiraceae bacterium]|nr:DUF3298 domain-containing protein [Lachnospiraceae bacterium]